MYKQAIVNNLIKIAKINALNATGATVGAGIGGTGGYLGSNWLSKKLGLQGPNISRKRRIADIALRTLGTAGGASLGGYIGYLGGDALHNKWYGAKPTEAAQEPVDETAEQPAEPDVVAQEPEVDYSLVDNGVNGEGYNTKDFYEDYNRVGYLGQTPTNVGAGNAKIDGTVTLPDDPGVRIRRLGKNGERYNVEFIGLPTGRRDYMQRDNIGKYFMGGNIADLTPERINQIASVAGNLSNMKLTPNGANYDPDAMKDYIDKMLKIMPEGTPLEYRVGGPRTEEERNAKLKEISDLLFNTYGNTPISADPKSIDNRVKTLLTGNKPGFIGTGASHAFEEKGGPLREKYYGDNTYEYKTTDENGYPLK